MPSVAWFFVTVLLLGVAYVVGRRSARAAVARETAPPPAEPATVVAPSDPSEPADVTRAMPPEDISAAKALEMLRSTERRFDMLQRTSSEIVRTLKDELEAARAEKAILNIAVQEGARIREEKGYLERELEGLRARLFVEFGKRAGPTPDPGPTSGGVAPRGLDGLVRKIGALDKVRAAAIGDENGFLVASAGDASERGEALAAFGSLMSDLGKRATTLLPLHDVREIRIVDAHETTVVARPLDRASSDLVLVWIKLGRDSEPRVRSIIAEA